MSVISNEEFAKRVLLLAEPAGCFRPTATYDRDGDCIEFLDGPDPFFAERVDDLVTVYYSQQTGRVIGSFQAARLPPFKPGPAAPGIA
jgi:hypothetical protein